MSPRASGCGYIIGTGLTGLGLFLTARGEGGGFGPLAMGLVIIAAIWLEPRYGRQTSIEDDGKVTPTGERFIDDETGQLVEVWYDPANGERSYRAVNHQP